MGNADMITRIEVQNYRCLRHVDVKLDRFHVLVGPNASGKSTLLDALAFLRTLVRDGLDKAIDERTSNFYDLVWGREGNEFGIAIATNTPSRMSYQTRLRMDPDEQRVVFAEEAISHDGGESSDHRSLFADLDQVIVDGIDSHLSRLPRGIVGHWGPKTSGIVTRSDYYPYSVSRTSSILAFPDLDKLTGFSGAAQWAAELERGMYTIRLESHALARPSPPGLGVASLTPTGSNLPWIVDAFKAQHAGPFSDWIAHLRTALPDLADIRVVERSEDRHKYLMLRYDSGVEVPSWMASDGTLRLIALTLLAYLPNLSGVYMIEEPETGIHPAAIETMCQSLRSVASAQILLATHSPIILNLVEPSELLCFSRDDEGATQIVRGDEHPALRNWKGSADLGLLLASGVLS
jgi:predicted ATPase